MELDKTVDRLAHEWMLVPGESNGELYRAFLDVGYFSINRVDNRFFSFYNYLEFKILKTKGMVP